MSDFSTFFPVPFNYLLITLGYTRQTCTKVILLTIITITGIIRFIFYHALRIKYNSIFTSTLDVLFILVIVLPFILVFHNINGLGHLKKIVTKASIVAEKLKEFGCVFDESNLSKDHSAAAIRYLRFFLTSFLTTFIVNCYFIFSAKKTAIMFCIAWFYYHLFDCLFFDASLLIFLVILLRILKFFEWGLQYGENLFKCEKLNTQNFSTFLILYKDLIACVNLLNEGFQLAFFTSISKYFIFLGYSIAITYDEGGSIFHPIFFIKASMDAIYFIEILWCAELLKDLVSILVVLQGVS